jgi:hypothetical protein
MARALKKANLDLVWLYPLLLQLLLHPREPIAQILPLVWEF